MPHAHFTAVWDVKLLAWLHVLNLFRPRDLDLYPMTFIYELYPYCVEIHRKCKCELSTWNLSKAIVWQTDRQTYRIDRNYRPRRFAGGHSADAKSAYNCASNAVTLAANYLPPRRYLIHGTSHLNLSDDRNRRLCQTLAGIRLTDKTVPGHVVSWIAASWKSTGRWTDSQCICLRTDILFTQTCRRDHQPGCCILYQLQSLMQFVDDAVHYHVAIVQASEYGTLWQWPQYGGNLSYTVWVKKSSPPKTFCSIFT